MTVLLVLFTLILFLVSDHFVQRHRTRQLVGVNESVSRGKFSVHSSIALPQGFSLATNHTWLKNNPDGTVTIGVDEFLGRLAGAFDEISLPRSGDALDTASRIGVRSHGRSLQLTTPVMGDVVDSNLEVLRDPSLILNDPYGKGWLMRVRPNANAVEKAGEFLVRRPAEWLNEQVAVVRDFLVMNSQVGQAVVLQEGGLPVDGVLQQFDENVWKEFAHSFVTLRKAKDTALEEVRS